MASLQNHILISMPHMQDPFFASSVVFICEHSKEGAMGLIINKRFQQPDLMDLFEKLTVGEDNLLEAVPEIYFGGPVLLERGIVLHPGSFESEGTVKISDDFAITSQKHILSELRKNDGISYKLMLGHSGWGAGQLEREIENGDWLLQSTTTDFVFNIPEEQMWKQAAGSLGMDLGHSSGIGGHA